MGSNEQILARVPYGVHELYDKYSGMLFGHIYEIVKDTYLAEQQLVSFYITVKDHLHELNADGANTWCRLQLLLKQHLSITNKPTDRVIINDHGGNKYLGMMNSEQKYVFYQV